MAYADIEKKRESWRKYYHENKDKERQRRDEKKKRCKDFVKSQKDGKPCMDCNMVYPHYVMDYDHRDPSTKKDTVSRLAAGGQWNALQAEIEKCDLVCANCHRIRTHRGIA